MTNEVTEYSGEEVNQMNEEINALGQGDRGTRPMTEEEIRSAFGVPGDIEVSQLDDVQAREVFSDGN